MARYIKRARSFIEAWRSVRENDQLAATFVAALR